MVQNEDDDSVQVTDLPTATPQQLADAERDANPDAADQTLPVVRRVEPQALIMTIGYGKPFNKGQLVPLLKDRVFSTVKELFLTRYKDQGEPAVTAGQPLGVGLIVKPRFMLDIKSTDEAAHCVGGAQFTEGQHIEATLTEAWDCMVQWAQGLEDTLESKRDYCAEIRVSWLWNNGEDATLPIIRREAKA